MKGLFEGAEGDVRTARRHLRAAANQERPPYTATAVGLVPEYDPYMDFPG